MLFNEEVFIRDGALKHLKQRVKEVQTTKSVRHRKYIPESVSRRIYVSEFLHVTEFMLPNCHAIEPGLQNLYTTEFIVISKCVRKTPTTWRTINNVKLC